MLATGLLALTGVLEIGKTHLTQGMKGLLGPAERSVYFSTGQAACADLI